jgi:TetR/AcrR family transcriptional regulator, cholesterol catabolism regulator
MPVKSTARSKRVRTRAVTESLKQERREALLAAAEQLFASRDYREVSMAEIAEKAGVAKGTVYLYFDTKEALFLDLVSQGMQAWMDDALVLLDGAERGVDDFASSIAQTLAQRPRLIRLLALLHAVLEHNTDARTLRAFKHRLLALTTTLGERLERSLLLTSGLGPRVVLSMHAAVVGLAQMTSPSPVLSDVLSQDAALAPFRVDFRRELEFSLRLLFAGAKEIAR